LEPRWLKVPNVYRVRVQYLDPATSPEDLVLTTLEVFDDDDGPVPVLGGRNSPGDSWGGNWNMICGRIDAKWSVALSRYYDDVSQYLELWVPVTRISRVRLTSPWN
jgi:hypothetical protein